MTTEQLKAERDNALRKLEKRTQAHIVLCVEHEELKAENLKLKKARDDDKFCCMMRLELQSELEKLEAEYRKVNVLNDSIAASVLHETAKRCAEIADRAKYLSDKRTTDDVANAIRKEFNL